MELKELIELLRKEAPLYAAIIISLVLLGLIWHAMQPMSYRADLLLNVGRSAGPEPAEYTYDDFYRLQADERFGDTVVRWLDSPRVTEDVFAEAKLPASGGAEGYFTGRRLSSQVIEVSFISGDQAAVKPLSEAAVRVLNRYAESLNPERREGNWFRVIGSEPVIGDGRVPQLHAFLVALFAGIFIGFWVVLGKHYFQKTHAHRD